MMKLGARSVSVLFFVATLAISVLAALKYSDLQETVADQRRTISQQDQKITRHAQLLKGSDAHLVRLRVEIEQQREEMRGNVLALERSRTRLARLEAENVERATTIARQRADIAQQRTAIVQQRIDIAANNRSIEDGAARLATLESASLYLEGGIRGMRDLTDIFGEACQRDARPGPRASLCTHIELMRLLTVALQTRMSAANSGRYVSMRENYRAIIQYVDAHPGSWWETGWRAIAGEGIAYAEMKLDRLPQAFAAASAAVELNQYDGGAGVTALKVMCRQGRPAAEVADGYAALVRRLEERIAATRPDDLQGRNARLERDLFLRDAELYSLCEDANLRRTTLPATPR